MHSDTFRLISTRYADGNHTQVIFPRYPVYTRRILVWYQRLIPRHSSCKLDSIITPCSWHSLTHSLSWFNPTSNAPPNRCNCAAIGLQECTDALLACESASCTTTSIQTRALLLPRLLILPCSSPLHIPGLPLHRADVWAPSPLLLSFVWITLGVCLLFSLLEPWTFFLLGFAWVSLSLFLLNSKDF
jgi:hypothetical protein